MIRILIQRFGGEDTHEDYEESKQFKIECPERIDEADWYEFMAKIISKTPFVFESNHRK